MCMTGQQSETELDRIHDILTDLLCSTMLNVKYEEPKIGDWCFEITSSETENRDCRIGRLVKIIGQGEFITVTVGGLEVHWTNAMLKKIPSQWMRIHQQKKP